MTNPTDPDKKLLSDIEESGYHVLHVPADEEGTGFSYTVGMHKTFSHPEIVIIGMPIDVADVVINNMGYDIKNGKTFESGKSYADILDDVECTMLSVGKEHYPDYFGYGKWYYKSEDFPVLQCVYPTSGGIFPWDEDAPEGFVKHQPVLGDPPRVEPLEG